MNPSRWIALLVVGLYAAACLWLPAGIDGPDQPRRQTSIAGKTLGLIPLVLGFVCVWWSEVLGDALWMGRGAWNPKPSSGGAVSILGWVFLTAAMVLCLAGHRIVPAVMGTH